MVFQKPEVEKRVVVGELVSCQFLFVAVIVVGANESRVGKVLENLREKPVFRQFCRRRNFLLGKALVFL